MKFTFAEDVLDFLGRRNQTELTINLEEIPSNCCLGRLPELRLDDTPPQDPSLYRNFSVHGINIHISNVLRTQDTLRLFLSGIGPFKKLGVNGINLVL